MSEEEIVVVRRIVLETIYHGIMVDGDAKNLLRIVLENNGETPGFTFAEPARCPHCQKRLTPPL